MKIVKKPDTDLEAVRIAKVGIYEHNRLLLSVTDKHIPAWLLSALQFTVTSKGVIEVRINGFQQLHALDYVVKEYGRQQAITVYSTEEFNERYSIIEEDKQ